MKMFTGRRAPVPGCGLVDEEEDSKDPSLELALRELEVLRTSAEDPDPASSEDSAEA